jgi:ribosome-associated protein
VALARKQDASQDSARRAVIEMARLLDDRHAEEILVLDLRTLSPVTDYFLIATGTSDRQMRALADELKDLGRRVGQKVWQVAGRETGSWIVMDFVDVVVHLFNQSLRTYYDLELIWGEAPRVSWERKPDSSSRRSPETL